VFDENYIPCSSNCFVLSINGELNAAVTVTGDGFWKFDYHINEKVNKSYSVLGLIHRHFKYMSSDTFVMYGCHKYETLVRSHLEYANCVWSPYRQIDIEKM